MRLSLIVMAIGYLGMIGFAIMAGRCSDLDQKHLGEAGIFLALSSATILFVGMVAYTAPGH